MLVASKVSVPKRPEKNGIVGPKVFGDSTRPADLLCVGTKHLSRTVSVMKLMNASSAVEYVDSNTKTQSLILQPLGLSARQASPTQRSSLRLGRLNWSFL